MWQANEGLINDGVFSSSFDLHFQKNLLIQIILVSSHQKLSTIQNQVTKFRIRFENHRKFHIEQGEEGGREIKVTKFR